MQKLYITIFSLLILFFSSCEEEFIPKASTEKPKVAVEAYLELGSNTLASYVVLTRSLNFYTNIGQEAIDKAFVHDAEVVVIEGQDSVRYQELCLNDLSPELRKQVTASFGIDIDSIKINYCVYVDLSGRIKPKDFAAYKLYVKTTEGEVVTAKTTIPRAVPVDSFWFDKRPGNGNDSFMQLFCIIADPSSEKNYYRYWTANQNENLTANISSVTDDVFFDGQKFKFSLSKALGPDEEFNENSGLYLKGDTIRVKWCTLDSDHFEFWNTLEVSATRQGPFANYVRIKHNINGGLGIFGGYNCNYYTLVVPK